MSSFSCNKDENGSSSVYLYLTKFKTQDGISQRTPACASLGQTDMKHR